jgi:ferritin-like metal-binding protein YciE
MNKESYEIAAYITLDNSRTQNGNPLILVAKNLEEQKQLSLDIAKAIKGDIVQLHCGDYMVII